MTPDEALAWADGSNGSTYALNDTKAMKVLRDEVRRLRAIVSAQAEDEGLWFVARTAPEAYLQQELRKLHAAVEGTPLLEGPG